MTTSTPGTPHAAAAALPLAGLLALAMTGFICIVTETLPAGLLPQIAADFGTSNAVAGQTVSAYAAGSLLAAIPLTIATRGWRRRSALLLAILGFLVFNVVTTLSSHYGLTLVARFCAGVAAGLAWSLLAGYARRMVPTHQQGRALAVAMVGTPVALALGVPFGTWLGAAMGWRNAFAVMSAATLVLVAWVLAKVPDYPGQAGHARLPLARVLLTPGVRPVLGVVLTWMLAHNILYTYIAPFVAQAGLGAHVDTILLVFGLAALASIWIAGRLVDDHLRAAVLASLAVFGLVCLLSVRLAHMAAAIYAGAALWGLSFGGAATLLQTALADSAGEGADVALALNVVVWNSAIAGGGVIGGALLDGWGAAAFAPVLVALLALGFGIAWRARAHGFRAGPRGARAQSR